jgi:hypothetical protein
MVYQFSLEKIPIAKFQTLKQASESIGISWKTISSAIINESKCHGKWFFSKHPEMNSDRIFYDEKLSVKTSIILTETMSSDFIRLAGQRNRQGIIRALISDWIKLEKEK